MYIKTLILFLLIGCGAKKGPLSFRDTNSSENNGVRIELKTQDLSFKILKGEILKPRCLSCHSTQRGRVEPDGDPIDFDSYKSMMKKRFIPLLKKGSPNKSRLYKSVHSGNMPIRGKLNDEQIQYISDWIMACAPQKEFTGPLQKCQNDDDDNDDDFGDDDFNDDIF